MRFPRFRPPAIFRDMVDTFAGYNHNPRIRPEESYDMKNLSSDGFPVMTPRRQRGTYKSPVDCQGMLSKDAFIYVDGSDLVVNEYHVDMMLSTASRDNPKQLISMGAWVIIMPDKKYINTENLTDFGDIEARYTSRLPVSFTLSKIDGEEYGKITTQDTAPENPGNGSLWVDTSTKPHVLKQWSASQQEWVSIATTYIKIGCQGIGKAFGDNDGVRISGLTGDLIDHDTSKPISDPSQLQALNGYASIQSRGDDWIVVVGILDSAYTIDNEITITRQMPIMDFMIESGNRLWGCRYGPSASGEIVNEIYASALGDFKNWSRFQGVSTDSYRVGVGSDGPWTGAITHMGFPCFFKENHLHKVYGSFPAEYRVQDTACRGVQQYSDGSLAIVNEVLYYKSASAVVAYDGSLPVEISGALGDIPYSNAVAGTVGNKYYISMMSPDHEYTLFVYDTIRQMWHKEDGLHVLEFCGHKGELYYRDGAGIRTILGSGKRDLSSVKWMAESGPIGMETPDYKYIQRVNIRMSLGIGSIVQVFIRYDMEENWEPVASLHGTSLRMFTLPICARRCDHFRLRIEGEGEMQIYSISKNYRQGSDR